MTRYGPAASPGRTIQSTAAEGEYQTSARTDNGILACRTSTPARPSATRRLLDLLARLSDRGDRIDPAGVEREPFFDHAHLVVRRLIGPDRVLGAVLQREVRGSALEGAVGLLGGRDEPIHVHVIARDVIGGGVAPFLQLDRVPAVGDEFSVEPHLHAQTGRPRGDALVWVLRESGRAVGAHRYLLSRVPNLGVRRFPVVGSPSARNGA